MDGESGTQGDKERGKGEKAMTVRRVQRGARI